MKSTQRKLNRAKISTVIFSLFLVINSQASGQTPIPKADNADDLNQTTSWSGGIVPGSNDIALWDSTVTSTNSVLLGANLSWRGIRLTNPGVAVTIGAGNTLTLGTGGIDMSSATQNLTISSGLVLSGGQTWNVASGRTLSTGAFTRSGVGTTLIFDRSVNTGTVAATPTLTNGIVGPWAIVRNAGTAANGSANGYTFATVSAGNLTAYTGATSQTLTTAWGGIASGGTGTVNYDISSTAALLGATGLNRNVNTLRYTGAGARQAGNNAADLLTVNAIMNSGTGAFVLGRDAANIANDFSFGILVGASGELVLAPMTADLTLHSFIKNNGATAGNVTVVGNNTLSLTSANTYTGATTINGGTLHVSGSARGTGSGSINATSGITVNGANAKYLHTSTTASTRNLTLTQGTVDGTGSIGAVTVADNASNIVANGNLTGTNTLTLSSLAFHGDAVANLRLGAGVGFNVTGALSTTAANGTVTINATKSGWVLGTNNLISFGSFSGSASDFTVGSVTGLSGRQVQNGLTVSGNFLALDVAGDLPVWTGVNGSAWTTAATNDNTGPNNWATKTALSSTNFWIADTPEFNDTYDVGAGSQNVINRSVDIQGADVAPGIVNFNNSTGDYTLSSSTGHGISGGASLVKFGTSKLIITNTNTFTGATTINGGTIQIGDGTTNGSIANTASITNNGSLVYNLTTAQTYANVISGTGSLTKEGAGVLTLSGNNSYQGGTTISTGAITLTGAGTLGSGSISIASGSSLNNSGTGITTAGTVSGSGNFVSTASNTITGGFSGFSGTYTHNNTTVSTSFNSLAATSENAAYVLNSVQGSSQGFIAGLSGDNTLKIGSLSGVAGSLFRGGNVATGTTTLQIGSLNTDTTFAGSINNGATKTLALDKVGTGSLILSGVSTFTGATNVTGGTLAVTGAGSMNGTSGITVNGANAKYVYGSSVAGTKAISLLQGTLDGAGTVGAVTVADLATNVVANGNGGNGSLTLSSLTFDGDAVINLSLGTGPGLNVTGALTTNAANGQVTLNASKTGWLLGTNSLIGFGTFGGSVNDFTLGTVSGLGARQTLNGGLIVTGNAITLDVVGEIPVWTGANGNAWTTVADGNNAGPNNWITKTAQMDTNFWANDTIEFNDTYDTGAGSVAVTNRNIDIQGGNVSTGGVSFDNSAGNYTLSSAGGFGISGAGGLSKSGDSALTIETNNTYTGTTAINAGTVNLTGGLNGTAITVATGANLNVSGTGVISGASSLAVNGNAVLTSANTYTGATTVGVGGTLSIGDGTTDGSIAAASPVTNNGSIVFNTVGPQTGGNTITGTGTLTKNGVGTLTLSSANSYSGGTTISAGAVTLAGAGTIGSGSINVATGASLNIAGNAYTTSATVTGAGDIVSTTGNSITGNMSGFSGTYTHNTATQSTVFNSATASSQDTAYVLSSVQGSSQGFIAGFSGDNTLQLGSLSGVTDSLFRGGNTATGTTTLQIGNLNTDTTFAGSINNGATKLLALEKVGTGTLTLSGATNTYTGATTVTSGTLIVDGNTSSSTVTITSDGVLGGSGQVGSITVQGGGVLSPGNSIESLASGTVNFASGSTFEFEFDTASLNGDLLDINAGDLNITSGAILSLTELASGTATVGDKLALISYTGTWNGGLFDYLGNSLLDDSTISIGANSWLVNYNDTIAGMNFAGDQVGASGYLTITATAVPEPSTLLLLGAGAVYAYRRRRLNSKLAMVRESNMS